MRKLVAVVVCCGFTGAAFGANQQGKTTPAAPAPTKERYVECRGKSEGEFVSEKDKDFFQVFRLTEDTIHPDGWDDKIVLKVNPSQSDADSTVYALKDKEGWDYFAQIFHKTGRIRFQYAAPSGTIAQMSEGDCKKFVPSKAFE